VELKTSQLYHSHFYHFIAYHFCSRAKSETTFHYTRCIMPVSTELASHISATLLQGFANVAYKEL